MAFVSGPESTVCVPGASDSFESRDCAKVRVTNGFSFLVKVLGKYGSMKVLDPSGKVKEGFGGEWCSIVAFEIGG